MLREKSFCKKLSDSLSQNLKMAIKLYKTTLSFFSLKKK